MHVTIRPHATDDGIAAELVQLLEVMVADGVITDAEIGQLQNWLDINDSEAPAFMFLRATLELILADGKITNAERIALHKAIERILPPDLRKQSKAVRTASELVTKERERGAATEQKQREREERERSGQQYNLNCMVMGVAYEDRGALIEKCLTISQAVFLVRETGNPFDHNAVLIRIPQGHIGYIPREYAEEIAQLLDKGYRQIAYCTKILQGKRFPIPVVQTYLYRPDSTMGIETPAPYPYRATENKPSQPARTSGSSCLGCALAAVVVVALMVLVLIMIFS